MPPCVDGAHILEPRAEKGSDIADSRDSASLDAACLSGASTGERPKGAP